MISLKGIDFIKKEEGLSIKAYQDNTRVSIGYGCTFYQNGVPVKLGDTITKAQADALLLYHAKLNEGYLNTYVKTTLKQSQRDALISLIYNIGPGNFSNRWRFVMDEVRKNPNNYTAVKAAFLKVPHLKERRLREFNLYASADTGAVASTPLIVTLLMLLLGYFFIKTKNDAS
jgi:GH24 family phage-related lysozyme (muramidase)